MQLRQPDEQALALLEQVHLDFSTVALARAPLNESPCFAARNECRNAMGLGLKALGKLADMRVVAPGISLDMKEHQILERRNAVRSNRSLGESLESTHLITKFRQLLECCLGQYFVVWSSHRTRNGLNGLFEIEGT
jgi:hypothetical protein